MSDEEERALQRRLRSGEHSMRDTMLARRKALAWLGCLPRQQLCETLREGQELLLNLDDSGPMPPSFVLRPDRITASEFAVAVEPGRSVALLWQGKARWHYLAARPTRNRRSGVRTRLVTSPARGNTLVSSACSSTQFWIDMADRCALRGQGESKRVVCKNCERARSKTVLGWIGTADQLAETGRERDFSVARAEL